MGREHLIGNHQLKNVANEIFVADNTIYGNKILPGPFFSYSCSVMY